MKKFNSEFYQETYFFKTLDNGLKVYIMPKKDYFTKYAFLVTKYGSIDSEFIPRNENKYVKVPYGIAHFLEHKMFESPSCEIISDEFASIGADVNAYTSYDYTVYYTSATKNFEQALNLLLDFVQTKGYTKKSIKSEVGIIEQELMMYLDDSGVIMENAVNNAMYYDNLVRIDIGGTIDSIKEITKEHLDLCYDTFYHPSNMGIVIVGDVNEEDILNLIENNQKAKTFLPPYEVKRKYYLEDNKVKEKSILINKDVLIPKVSVNVKLGYEALSSEELTIKDYALTCLMYQEFDITSNFYQQLLKEEIINESFAYDVTIDDTFGHINVYTNTDKVEEFIEKVKNHLLSLKDITVSKDSFETYKKINIARLLRRMNSIDSIGEMMVQSHLGNVEFFNDLEMIKKLTYDDVKKVRKYFIEDAITTVVMKN